MLVLMDVTLLLLFITITITTNLLLLLLLLLPLLRIQHVLGIYTPNIGFVFFVGGAGVTKVFNMILLL